jgi:hypothetical protein
MTIRPTDLTDLFLAPVALSIDAELAALSTKTPEELQTTIALRTNREPASLAERREHLLRAVEHVVELHDWTLSWDRRGLRLVHGDHTLVLGLPANLRSYLEL